MEEFSGKKYSKKDRCHKDRCHYHRFVSPGLKNNPYLGLYTYHHHHHHRHHLSPLQHFHPAASSSSSFSSTKFSSPSYDNTNTAMTTKFVQCTCGESSLTSSLSRSNTRKKSNKDSHTNLTLNNKEDNKEDCPDNSNQFPLEFYPYNSNMYTSQPGSQLNQNSVSKLQHASSEKSSNSNHDKNNNNRTNLISSKIIPFLPEPFRSTSAYVGSFRHAPSMSPSSTSHGIPSSRSHSRSYKREGSSRRSSKSKSSTMAEECPSSIDMDDKNESCGSCSVLHDLGDGERQNDLSTSTKNNSELHSGLHNSDSIHFKKYNNDGQFSYCCSPFTIESSTPSFSCFSSSLNSSSNGRTTTLVTEDNINRFPINQNSVTGKHGTVTSNLFSSGLSQSYNNYSNGTTPKTSFTRSPHNSHYGYSSFSPSFVSSSFSSIGKSIIPLSASPSTCGIEVYMNQIELSRKHRNAQNKVHSHELALLESLSYREYIHKIKKGAFCDTTTKSETDNNNNNNQRQQQQQRYRNFSKRKNDQQSNENIPVENSYYHVSVSGVNDNTKRDRALDIIPSVGFTSTLSETDEDETLFAFEDHETSIYSNSFQKEEDNVTNCQIQEESESDEDLELDYSLYDRDYCTVCMALINHNEIIRVLPCSHIFHRKCIDTWLTGNLSWEGNNTRACPVCKHTLDFQKLRMEKDNLNVIDNNKFRKGTSITSEISSPSFRSTLRTSFGSDHDLDSDTNTTTIPKWAFVSAIVSCSSNSHSNLLENNNITNQKTYKRNFMKPLDCDDNNNSTTINIQKGSGSTSSNENENSGNSYHKISTHELSSCPSPSHNNFSLLKTDLSSGIAPPYTEIRF